MEAHKLKNDTIEGSGTTSLFVDVLKISHHACAEATTSNETSAIKRAFKQYKRRQPPVDLSDVIDVRESCSKIQLDRPSRSILCRRIFASHPAVYIHWQFTTATRVRVALL